MNRTQLLSLKLLLPITCAVGLRFSLWLEALIYHRGRTDPRFRKIIGNNASWFVLGMGYIALWRFELGDWLHWQNAWKLLLVFLAIFLVQRTIRQLRPLPSPKPATSEAEPETEATAANSS